MPVRFIITGGPTADCKKAIDLIDGIDASHVFGDRGYDSNEIVDFIEGKGMESVIPPRKNRKHQRYYDKELYKLRHLVENAFLHLKRWRGIATRYANEPHHSLLLYKSGVLLFGLNSHDDTI